MVKDFVKIFNKSSSWGYSFCRNCGNWYEVKKFKIFYDILNKWRQQRCSEANLDYVGLKTINILKLYDKLKREYYSGQYKISMIYWIHSFKHYSFVNKPKTLKAKQKKWRKKGNNIHKKKLFNMSVSLLTSSTFKCLIVSVSVCHSAFMSVCLYLWLTPQPKVCTIFYSNFRL